MKVKSKNKLLVVLTCLMAAFVAFACFTMLKTSDVKAATNGMTFDEKVQVRTVPSSFGIRFAFNINQDTYNLVSADADAEIGAVIVPAFVYQKASALEGDLIDNILALYPKNTKDGITAKVNLANLTANDGIYTAGCSLTNIKDANLKYDYQAIGYYTLDGENYVYGLASESESMASVAYEYLTSGEFVEEEIEEKGILTNYIAKTAALKVNGTVDGVVVDELTGNATLDINVDKELGQSADLSSLYATVAPVNTNITVQDGVMTLGGEKAISEKIVATAADGAITYNVNVIGAPVVEADVKDGLDVAALLPDGTEIDWAKLGETDKTVSDGKVSFEVSEPSADKQVITVADVNGVEYKIKATVWSLLIDSETELKAMNQYTNATTLSGAQKTWGYFKLTDDIVMATDWSADYVVGKGDYVGGDHCVSGVFDGNGKTISNFVIPNGANHVSMFYSVGKDFVMKNVKIEAENKTTGGYNSAIIAEYVSGGTFENIDITLKLPAVYIYNNIVTIGGAGLFEYFGGTGTNYDLTLTDVKVIAASNDMTTANCAPLGIIYGSNANQNAEALKSKIKLNGVVFAGFKNVMFDVVTPICTLDQLKGVSTCDADVKVYATLAEYNESLYIKLNAVDVDVKDGFDVNAVLPENVSAVTVSYNDSAVELVDGKISYTATDASNQARNYIITATDGNIYTINATVWSLLIDNEEELQSMNQYSYTTKVYSMNATFGYYKLMENITMQNAWQASYTVGIGDYQVSTNGWHGIFDGNGKSITNFNLERDIKSKNAGLFYCIAGESVIKNLKLEGTSDAYFGSIGGSSGLVAYSVAGGTIENVEFIVNVPDTYTPDTDPLCAGIFGELYPTANNAKLVMKNVKIIAKDNTMASKATIAPLGRMKNSVAKDMIEMTDVVFAGFGNILYDSNKTAISNLDGLNTIATCSNVQVYATLADYEATLA